MQVIAHVGHGLQSNSIAHSKAFNNITDFISMLVKGPRPLRLSGSQDKVHTVLSRYGPSRATPLALVQQVPTVNICGFIKETSLFRLHYVSEGIIFVEIGQ